MNKKTHYKNNGFSLIEIIIYISLLSFLILGVFSSIMSLVYFERPLIDQDDYGLLIENYHEE